MSFLYQGAALAAQVITPKSFKTCGCGKTYTEVQWEALEEAGHQHTEADDEGPAVTIECRNCTCGSTLAVEVKP